MAKVNIFYESDECDENECDENEKSLFVVSNG